MSDRDTVLRYYAEAIPITGSFMDPFKVQERMPCGVLMWVDITAEFIKGATELDIRLLLWACRENCREWLERKLGGDMGINVSPKHGYVVASWDDKGEVGEYHTGATIDSAYIAAVKAVKEREAGK